jgi:hypothetical protein
MFPEQDHILSPFCLCRAVSRYDILWLTLTPLYFMLMLLLKFLKSTPYCKSFDLINCRRRGVVLLFVVGFELRLLRIERQHVREKSYMLTYRKKERKI